ncbi:hypothetical protein FRC11_010750, partial [Ceratobasidium sp. 423]
MVMPVYGSPIPEGPANGSGGPGLGLSLACFLNTHILTSVPLMAMFAAITPISATIAPAPAAVAPVPANSPVDRTNSPDFPINPQLYEDMMEHIPHTTTTASGSGFSTTEK